MHAIAGAGATSAPFIATIDDDATACPQWLEIFLQRFSALPQNVAGVGGEIDPAWQKPPPGWLTAKMKTTLSAAFRHGG